MFESKAKSITIIEAVPNQNQRGPAQFERGLLWLNEKIAEDQV